MDSRQLRYFVAVARERNFTRAAEKLHIAQPPLSRQIQQLEQEFGVTLLDRGSRPLALTDAGRLLLEQALQVIERMDEITAMLGRIREAKKRRFSIGFVGSVLYGYLPEVIRRYRMARPGVELTLLELPTIEQIGALKEGRIDVGFGRIAFDDPLIQQSLLHNEKICAALSRRHALALRTGPLRFAELAGVPLIIYPRTPRPSYADAVLALFRERGITPAALHEVRDVQTGLGLVAADIGVCLVPSSVQRLGRENVVYRPLDEAAAVSPIFMNARKGHRSAEIDFLLKLIREISKRQSIVFGA